MTKQVEQAWNEYAQKYNVLADKMAEAGLPFELLREVIEAARKVEVARWQMGL